MKKINRRIDLFSPALVTHSFLHKGIKMSHLTILPRDNLQGEAKKAYHSIWDKDIIGWSRKGKDNNKRHPDTGFPRGGDSHLFLSPCHVPSRHWALALVWTQSGCHLHLWKRSFLKVHMNESVWLKKSINMCSIVAQGLLEILTCLLCPNRYHFHV